MERPAGRERESGEMHADGPGRHRVSVSHLHQMPLLFFRSFFSFMLFLFDAVAVLHVPRFVPLHFMLFLFRLFQAMPIAGIRPAR